MRARSHLGLGCDRRPGPPGRLRHPTEEGRHERDDRDDRADRDGGHRSGPGGAGRRLLPREARRAVRDPRRGRADRRPMARPLGVAPSLQPCPLGRPPGQAIPRSVARAGRRAARWPTTSRPTRAGSSCRSGAGRGSIASSSRRGSDELRRDDRGGSARAHGRSSSRRGRSASRTSRNSPVELDPSIRQLHSHEYRNPDQLADGPVLVVGLSPLRRRHRVRGRQAGHRTILSGKSHGADADPGHRHVAGHALAGRSSSSCSRTRAHDAYADGAEDAPGGPQGRRRRSCGSAWATWTGPASSATTARPSASWTAGRCSPMARSSTSPT